MAKNITVGLDDFHYAIMTDEVNETYDEPVHIPGSIQATVTPTTNSATLYADDKAYEVATSLGDIALVLNLADIPTKDHAALLGHTIDANGVMVRSADDVAPYVAIGYRRRMANGKFRCVWLYKGKFQPEEQDAQTKADTPSFQTPTVNATFVPRDRDNEWQAVVNQGDPGVSNATITNWFDNVYESVSDTTPPAISGTVPADTATSVAVGTTIKWTFTKAIRPNTVTAANFLVQEADGSAQVAGTLSLSTDGTEVTFTPSSNLSAATEYMAIVTPGVKDLAGNALAAVDVIVFETA